MALKRFFSYAFSILVIALLLISCQKKPINFSQYSGGETLSYEVTENGKLECFLNGPFLKSNVIIWYTDSSGKKTDVTFSDDTIFNYSSAEVGKTICEVTYKHYLSASFEIKVTTPQIVGLDLRLIDGGTNSYLIGDVLDKKNYLTSFILEDGSRKTPFDLKWYLISPVGTKTDASQPFTTYGIYRLYVEYNSIVYDFEEVYVSYPEDRIIKFDSILAQYSKDNDRYHVDTNVITLSDEADYDVSITGLRSFIERKDELGNAIKEAYQDYFFTSRLSISSVGSLLKFELNKKLRIEITVNSSDGRDPYFIDENGKQNFMTEILTDGNIKLYYITLDEGVYQLTSSNASLYIYSYTIIDEIA